jgi:uncharacterized protein (TIGR02145 family)
MKKILLIVCIMSVSLSQAQTVADWDGNLYDVVEIGEQTWIQQNLKSLHYSDGTPIPDVRSYNDSDSLSEIYGRLYTWDAAMKNSTVPGAQGICPEGWHIPTTQEFIELEDFLGGPSVAGAAMKEEGTDHWNPPNTGATNSSGLTILPGGEYDTPNGVYQFLGEYAVLWTSTEISSNKARERFLAYNSTASMIYDWHKSLNYSIRCVKDATTSTSGINQNHNLLITPNPVRNEGIIVLPSGTKSGEITIFMINGKKVRSFKTKGGYSNKIDASSLNPGLYVVLFVNEDFTAKTPLVKAHE